MQSYVPSGGMSVLIENDCRTRGKEPAPVDIRSGRRAFVEAGGLMSYGGTSATWTGARPLTWTRFSKGAKPADFRSSSRTKFEFIINLKAAKQIGLTIPPIVLYRERIKSSSSFRFLSIADFPIQREPQRMSGHRIGRCSAGAVSGRTESTTDGGSVTKVVTIATGRARLLKRRPLDSFLWSLARGTIRLESSIMDAFVARHERAVVDRESK